MNFDKLGLGAHLLGTLSSIGFHTATEIQSQAIPVFLGGYDLIGCAQTGTGKTASFLLPMIERLSQGRSRARMPRALILEPTRELAQQVADAFTLFSKDLKLSAAVLIGGEGMGDQEKKLQTGVDLIIATPGRFMDFMDRGRLLLNDIKFLVIDEADRMLDMGFIPDVERILARIPKTRQTGLYSATLPPPIQHLLAKFLKDPVRIETTRVSSTAQTVTQWRLPFDFPKKSPSDAQAYVKRQAVRHLLSTESIERGVIFLNKKQDVDYLLKSLTRHGFSALSLHGNMVQSVRTQTLEAFKRGDAPILIASDVAARGIDIEEVTHVISYDVPINAEDYVHRIGRTGRAGRLGTSYLFTLPHEDKRVVAVEELIQTSLKLFSLPEISGWIENALNPDKKNKKRTSSKGEVRLKKPRAYENKKPSMDAETAVEVPEEEVLTDQDGEHSAGIAGSLYSSDKVSAKKPTSAREHRHKPRYEPSVVGFGDEIPAFMRTR